MVLVAWWGKEELLKTWLVMQRKQESHKSQTPHKRSYLSPSSQDLLQSLVSSQIAHTHKYRNPLTSSPQQLQIVSIWVLEGCSNLRYWSWSYSHGTCIQQLPQALWCSTILFLLQGRGLLHRPNKSTQTNKPARNPALYSNISKSPTLFSDHHERKSLCKTSLRRDETRQDKSPPTQQKKDRAKLHPDSLCLSLTREKWIWSCCSCN